MVSVSAVIPAYNAASTIGGTLESVLRQSVTPDEIIVVDDGSTDETVSIVSAFGSRVTFHRQENRGVAETRNLLCSLARGELIAFLDHDDVWHPRYIETQCASFAKYPDAGALFTCHTDFIGPGYFRWPQERGQLRPCVEVLSALEFFVAYNRATGPFGSMSYCCVPRVVIAGLGNKPFRISGVDDSYFLYQVALSGRPVVYVDMCLVAYRITDCAQSDDKLKAMGLWIDVFQELEGRLLKKDEKEFRRAYRQAFASKRRTYAKILMGAEKPKEARAQLMVAASGDDGLIQKGKTLGLLAATFLPDRLQPPWQPSHR